VGISGNRVFCEGCALNLGLALYYTPSELLQSQTQPGSLAFRFPRLRELWDVPLVRVLGLGVGAGLLYRLLSSDSEPEDTYVYDMFHTLTKVYTGETNRRNIRPLEHQRSGKAFTRVAFYGPMTKSAARQMQADRLAAYRRRHRGANPTYNLTMHG
jgi:hypothetical protein